MNSPQGVAMRRRMKTLQDIPDSQRTDEEWDELNELEIMLAPGNRIDGPDPSARRGKMSGYPTAFPGGLLNGNSQGQGQNRSNYEGNSSAPRGPRPGGGGGVGGGGGGSGGGGGQAAQGNKGGAPGQQAKRPFRKPRRKPGGVGDKPAPPSSGEGSVD